MLQTAFGMHLIRTEGRLMRVFCQQTPKSSARDAIVVWHIRLGDMVLHGPRDRFYRHVLVTLRDLAGGHRLWLVMVGKTAEHEHVPNEYLHHFETLIASIWNAVTINERPSLFAPSYSFRESFLAMTQAVVLIGSGSALPIVAAHVSQSQLFFNHVRKGGYHFGSTINAGGLLVFGQRRP
jgi:hypothetical protein